MASRILVPATAVVLVIGAAVGVRHWLQGSARPVASPVAAAPAVPRKTVLVAAEDLGTGSFVKPTAIRWQDWPDVTVPDTYFVEGSRPIDDLLGAVVRHPVAKGQPITDGSLAKPGDRGFLAAVLTPGTRAVSVAIDEASGNAGLVFPGDHVDVILTQSLAREEDGPKGRHVSETVLEDVRVLAVGRRLAPGTGEEPKEMQARTVTLEVTPRGAERVALVGELGKLSLSLRSLATDLSEAVLDPNDRPPTWDSDASRARGYRPEAEPGPKVNVLRGGTKADPSPKGSTP